MVKNPPAIWETWIQSLRWEDPLKEGVATHSGILAWRIPMDRGAWWAVVHKESNMTEKLSTAHHLPGWDTGGWGRQYRKGKNRVGKKHPSLAPLPLKLLLSLSFISKHLEYVLFLHHIHFFPLCNIEHTLNWLFSSPLHQNLHGWFRGLQRVGHD